MLALIGLFKLCDWKKVKNRTSVMHLSGGYDSESSTGWFFLSAYLYVWICMLVEYKIATLSPNCIWRVCAHTAHSTLSWLRSIFNCDWRACNIHASHIPCAQISTSIFLVSVTLEQTRPAQNRMQPGFFMAYSPLWSVDLLWNWNMCSRARHCRLRALT